MAKVLQGVDPACVHSYVAPDEAEKGDEAEEGLALSPPPPRPS